MKLTFFGAAREVTGSCYLLEANGRRLLIDCGMQQGQDVKNNQNFPFSPTGIDALILTHAHIDHSGRIPLLVKLGFDGSIFTTRATSELITIMLADSAHIQEMDAQWENRKGKRAGNSQAVPLYDIEDVNTALRLVSTIEYTSKREIFDGISIMFTDAGHLLGSASIQIWVTEEGKTRKIVFSGDIGNIGQPIIRDPQYIDAADFVVMEGTYGDRDHEHTGDYVGDLAGIIEKTLGRGGNVIIPSFAVGRTQELLYFIREIKEKNLVRSVPNFKVFVDSPLAEQATRIYDRDLRGYADEETIQILKSGTSPTIFDDLRITETTDESRNLNEDPEPKVIISASGMCDAGRIRHHLKHNLWRSESTILFVGYQANGTLGRIILEGVDKVKLFGEEIVVRAEIVNFRGLSAHADKTGLLKWIRSFTTKPELVFIVHGESSVCDGFSATLKADGFNTAVPNYTSTFDLLHDEIISEGVTAGTVREAKEVKVVKAPDVYARLLEASEKLLSVIHENERGSNSELIKFTGQILDLARKWKR
ncbi:MAG: MBL fold metallo-hydrolase RNA specificity domain-containing protein [Saccharofermentanales bacterium]